MIYLGSKNRMSKYLAPIIQSYITDETEGYLEPFVGGGNMIDKIVCNKKVGSDIDKYVIAVLNGLAGGVEPPREVSREFYNDVKNHKERYSDFLVGYIGYELSFGGKWFGGYRKRDDKKFYGDIYSYNHCMKQAAKLKGITFECKSYDEYCSLKNWVIYCDPPYHETTNPKNTTNFDCNKFYNWCRKMAKDNTVLVSEYQMPPDFKCIWQKKTMVSLDSNKKTGDEKNWRTEKLFIAK